MTGNVMEFHNNVKPFNSIASSSSLSLKENDIRKILNCYSDISTTASTTALTSSKTPHKFCIILNVSG